MELIDGNNILIETLKIVFITIGIYYSDIKILGYSRDITLGKGVIIFSSSFIVTLIVQIIDKFNIIKSDNMVIVVILTSFIMSICCKDKFIYSLLVNIVSMAINQILLFLAIIIIYYPYKIFQIENEYINFINIMIINAMLLFLFWKIKRIKNGMNFLKKNRNSEYLMMLVLNISIIILFIIVIIQNYQEGVTSKFGTVLIIFSIIMFITIQKSLQLYYKHKMLVKALEETQKELNEKKEEVKKLEKENLNFSQTSHSISHRQKSIEHKLNILLANNENINSKDIENEIKNIRKELEIETKVKLKKTGIAVIDDMLSYMQAECIKNNINFQLQISGNMYHMVNNYIDKSDLEILLADHIKDAIIAVNHVETNNKSILVRIGEIDGKYGVYFYDSGVEFTIGTLIKLGKVPVTTYKEEGGSGMGFMNSFNTLNKYKATLIIEELNKPTNDNFTKVLKFIFNEEEKFKILSYRNQEIANKNNNKELIIEKLQK